MVQPKTKTNPKGAGRMRFPDALKSKSMHINMHRDIYAMVDKLRFDYQAHHELEKPPSRSKFICGMIQAYNAMEMYKQGE